MIPTWRNNKYSNLERGRKLLVGDIPQEYLRRATWTFIEDLYFQNTNIRLRKITNSLNVPVAYKITQRIALKGQSAYETTITKLHLSQEEYDVFAELPCSQVAKKRYALPEQGMRLWVDIFEGNLSGLILGKQEIKIHTDIGSLQIPNFALADITENNFFAEHHLALLPRDVFLEGLYDFYKKLEEEIPENYD